MTKNRLAQLEFITRVTRSIAAGLANLRDVTAHYTTEIEHKPFTQTMYTRDATPEKVLIVEESRDHPVGMPDWTADDDEHYRNVILEYLAQTMELVSPRVLSAPTTSWRDIAADMLRLGKVDEALDVIRENHVIETDEPQPMSKILTIVKEAAESMAQAFLPAHLQRMAVESIQQRMAVAIPILFPEQGLHEYDDTHDHTCGRCGKSREDHP